MAKFNKSHGSVDGAWFTGCHRRPTPPSGQTIRLQGAMESWPSFPEWAAQTTPHLWALSQLCPSQPRVSLHHDPRTTHRTRPNPSSRATITPALRRSLDLAASIATYLCVYGPMVQTLSFWIWEEHRWLHGPVGASWDQSWERTPQHARFVISTISHTVRDQGSCPPEMGWDGM